LIDDVYDCDYGFDQQMFALILAGLQKAKVSVSIGLNRFLKVLCEGQSDFKTASVNQLFWPSLGALGQSSLE